MKKKTYKIIILFLCILIFFAYGLLSHIKKPSLPLKFTAKEIPVIESYLHFQFPKSTRLIKAYWAPGGSIRYYFFFEFDKSDLESFMKTFCWDKDLEESKGDYGWRNIQNVPDVERLIEPVIKYDRVFFDTPGPSEELEWWKPDKSKIDKIFWVSDVKLKDVDIYVVNLAVLLEQLEKTCQVYVYVSWASLDDRGYMNKWYDLFPYDEHWKYRQTESIPYPLQQAINPIESNRK